MILIWRRVSATTLAALVLFAPVLVSSPPLLVLSAPLGAQTPAQPARANTVDTGVINGAPYYIEIPAQWNQGTGSVRARLYRRRQSSPRLRIRRV